MSVLLYKKVHIPDLDLPKLDINFDPVPGEVDEFLIHPEKRCYGSHCGSRSNAGATRERYQKCGWDGAYKKMPLHERIETNVNTREEVPHCIHACPDEYKREGKVIQMDFLKVAHSTENTEVNDEDDEYGGDDGFKLQTEWLPGEGTVPMFFEHLLRSMEAYLPHIHEIKLSNQVDKCAERSSIIDPVACDDFPKEFKGVVLEVMDFVSDIHAKRSHDLTCTFPKTHECEVHHITFAPKFVIIEKIEKTNP